MSMYSWVVIGLALLAFVEGLFILSDKYKK